MESIESNQFLNNQNNKQNNLINNYSSPLNNTSPASLFDFKNNINKNNLGDSSLGQYINDSIYDEMRYQYETKEILNDLRSKYLPNSTRNNKSMYFSQNMTYFNNKNNSNLQYSTFTDYNKIYSNGPNISTEKIDYYKSERENSKILQNSLLDNRDLININESIKINNESFKNSNINIDKQSINQNNKNTENNKNNSDNKTYLNDYLTKENEKLKIMNKNYELLIIPLIEYINEINFYFGKNVIDYHKINQIIKQKELSIDNKPLKDLKSLLKFNQNNIIDLFKNSNNFPQRKNKFENIMENINQNKINNDKRSFTYNIKEKKIEIDNYKPIIFDRINNNSEKNIFKNSDSGSVKRAKTFKAKLPTSFWSQNKRVKFKD